jgi:micrococcal nuclease
VDRQSLGSAVLIVAVAALLARPWEGSTGSPDHGPTGATAYVVRAIDGDTIEVQLGDHREDVRYIGVDTPETVKPGTPVQCFGERASHFDKRLVTHRRVRLVFGVEPRDVYGRLLAYVYLGRKFVNAVMVRRGLARTLEIPPNIRFAERFARLQTAAARAGRGLWGAC